MPPEPEKKVEAEKDPEVARREAAERALAANARRNADQLAIREKIADGAEGDAEHGEMLEVTDEMYDDLALPENVRNARAMAKAAARRDDEEEAAEELERRADEPENDQAEEERDDEAREAGADDVRMNEAGVKEYRLVVNGQEKWATLKEIRDRAQKVDAADEYLATAVETARRATRAAETGPSEEEKAEAARRQAERRARTVELLKQAAVGDEKAIEQLAELIDAAPPAVTPGVLRALDERLESRLTFREAVHWFEGEFASELKHPAMKSYAGELDAALAAQYPSMAPVERLRRVGTQLRRELRESFGIVGGKASEAKEEPSMKARRKAEASRRPQAAGERPAREESGDEAEDYSSVINKIAQSRHQPRAVFHGPIRGRSE